MALAVTLKASGTADLVTTSVATSEVLGAITFAANSVVLVFLGSTISAAQPYSELRASASGLTFTQETGVGAGSSTACMRVLSAPHTAGGSTVITIDSNGRTCYGMFYAIYEVTGHDTGDPIGAVAAVAQSATLDGAYSITLGGAPAASSIVISAIFADADAGTSTVDPGAGWTEDVDIDSPSTQFCVMELQRRTGSTSTTVAWADIKAGASPTLYSTAAVAVEVKAPAGPVTNVTRVGVTTGAPGAATAFAPTLPTHAADDRLILAVVGKYDTTTVPTINQGWTLVKSGTGGTGSTGNDSGQTFWAVYAKDAASASETAPTVTPGATAPNSWEWICASHRPGDSMSWADAIAASAAWVQSASDTTTASPLTGTCGAWTGAQPTTDDAIFAVGVIPTDLGTALGATTATATGLSGGTLDAATTNYVENPLGNDTAAVWAGWTSFTGTASAGLALSFTVTGATNQSGSLIGIALRQQSAGGFEGSADVAITADRTAASASIETADRTVAATLTASGAAAAGSDRATTATVTASGALAGQANRPTTATITAASATLSQASRASSVSATADGLLILRTAAPVSVGADITASSGVPTLQGSATQAATVATPSQGAAAAQANRATSTTLTGTGALASQAAQTATATITGQGAAAGQASRSTAVAVTASGALVGQASRAETVNLTATGLAAGQTSLAATVTISAAGIVNTTGTADRVNTVTLTASGQLPSAPSGDANRDSTATITATGNVTARTSADATSAVTLTAGSRTQTAAAQPLTATLSAAGNLTLRADADRPTTAAVTASGQLPSAPSGTGDRSATVNLTATGLVTTRTNSDRGNTVTVTASGQIPAQPSSTAGIAPTVNITAVGMMSSSGTATRPLTANITATGLIPAPPSGTANRAETVTITAGGQLRAFATATYAVTAAVTATGTILTPADDAFRGSPWTGHIQPQQRTGAVDPRWDTDIEPEPRTGTIDPRWGTHIQPQWATSVRG